MKYRNVNFPTPILVCFVTDGTIIIIYPEKRTLNCNLKEGILAHSRLFLELTNKANNNFSNHFLTVFFVVHLFVCQKVCL